MATPSSGFDMSKLSTGDKLVLGGAGAYFIWTFLPFWYKFDTADFGAPGLSDSINGFRGATLFAWILAVLAIIEIVVSKIAGTTMNLPMKRGAIHLGVAGLALLLTLLGLATGPSFYGISWGLFVAILIALVWAYGAYMMYSEPATTLPPPPPGTGTGGFTS
jgi:hypothetical protein